MDGTKPVYYIRDGHGDGRGKWNIFFEGGGWCYNMDGCVERTKTLVGSSKDYPDCLTFNDMKYYQSGLKEKNPLMYNWNTVHIKYCDGSSYAGDSIVSHNGMNLYFKGRRNREEFINTLLDDGMKHATDIVLSGCSAGGTSYSSLPTIDVIVFL